MKMVKNISAELQSGDSVLINWSNRETYRGVIRKKLRKNWSVKITDNKWQYRQNYASCPTHILSKRLH